jgi:glycosyltransferase involved in cell wall biosynthesis
MASLNSIKVSIAMTTYNGAKYLEEQLNSLLSQTLLPDEIVVCDDCSTDQTKDILAKYTGSGLIRVYINERQLGVIENFKKAVSLCSPSNYIALADQDDVWHDDKLYLQADELIKFDMEVPALVYTDLTLVDINLQVISPSFMSVLNIEPEKESLGSLLYGNFITGCTIMFNPAMRQYFLETPSTAYMHDAWLGLVAFSIGKSMYIPLPLVNYRQHGSNVTYETNKQVTALGKIRKIIEGLFSGKDYLKDNFTTARSFLDLYNLQLSEHQKRTLKDFIDKRRRSFMYKKVFSITSRSYRYGL